MAVSFFLNNCWLLDSRIMHVFDWPMSGRLWLMHMQACISLPALRRLIKHLKQQTRLMDLECRYIDGCSTSET